VKTAKVRVKFNTQALTRTIDEELPKRVLEAANEVRTTVLDTLSGMRHGRTYYVPGTRRKYTASAPGEAPATATAELRQSVKTSVRSEGRRVIGETRSDSKHALPLEFGTKFMAARPWLRVSFDKTIPKIKEILSRRWF